MPASALLCIYYAYHNNMFSRFDKIPACDGQTDRIGIAKTCFSIAADARKN